MNLMAHKAPTAPRNQSKRNPVTTKPKRNRAGYMQQYRANWGKLKVVTDNSGDAA